jgi:hypothetical protein
MFSGLCHAVRSSLDESKFEIPRYGFIEELSFNFSEYDEGREQLTIQPYYLRDKRLFGWLVDFHFRVREGVAFSRRIQQLSLSLDAGYKRNLDYYLDRMGRITEFLAQRRSFLVSVVLPGATVPLRAESGFTLILAKRLRSKTYLFAGNHVNSASPDVNLEKLHKTRGTLAP